MYTFVGQDQQVSGVISDTTFHHLFSSQLLRKRFILWFWGSKAVEPTR